MKPLSRAWAFLLASFFASVAATAQPAPIMGDGSKLRLIENPSGTIAFVRAVIEKFGLDKKHGFVLERVPAANIMAVTNAIRSGGGDVATADFMVISRLKKAGNDVVAVAPFLRWNDSIVAPASSSIQTVADFRGKKLGTPNRAASPWLIVKAVASKAYGVDLEKDAQVQEGNIALLRGMLEQGQLDAAYMFDNITPELVATGKFKVVTTLSDLVAKVGIPPDTPYVFVMATNEYAKAHPANMKAFLAAYREAVDLLKTDDKAWDDIAPSMKVTSALSAQVREEFRRPLLSRFTAATEGNVRKSFDVLLQGSSPEVLGLDKLPADFMTFDYQ